MSSAPRFFCLSWWIGSKKRFKSFLFKQKTFFKFRHYYPFKKEHLTKKQHTWSHGHSFDHFIYNYASANKRIWRGISIRHHHLLSNVHIRAKTSTISVICTEIPLVCRDELVTKNDSKVSHSNGRLLLKKMSALLLEQKKKIWQRDSFTCDGCQIWYQAPMYHRDKWRMNCFWCFFCLGIFWKLRLGEGAKNRQKRLIVGPVSSVAVMRCDRKFQKFLLELTSDKLSGLLNFNFMINFS